METRAVALWERLKRASGTTSHGPRMDRLSRHVLVTRLICIVAVAAIPASGGSASEDCRSKMPRKEDSRTVCNQTVEAQSRLSRKHGRSKPDTPVTPGGMRSSRVHADYNLNFEAIVADSIRLAGLTIGR